MRRESSACRRVPALLPLLTGFWVVIVQSVELVLKQQNTFNLLNIYNYNILSNLLTLLLYIRSYYTEIRDFMNKNLYSVYKFS